MRDLSDDDLKALVETYLTDPEALIEAPLSDFNAVVGGLSRLFGSLLQLPERYGGSHQPGLTGPVRQFRTLDAADVIVLFTAVAERILRGGVRPDILPEVDALRVGIGAVAQPPFDGYPRGDPTPAYWRELGRSMTLVDAMRRMGEPTLIWTRKPAQARSTMAQTARWADRKSFDPLALDRLVRYVGKECLRPVNPDFTSARDGEWVRTVAVGILAAADILRSTEVGSAPDIEWLPSEVAPPDARLRRIGDSYSLADRVHDVGLSLLRTAQMGGAAVLASQAMERPKGEATLDADQTEKALYSLILGSIHSPRSRHYHSADGIVRAAVKAYDHALKSGLHVAHWRESLSSVRSLFAALELTDLLVENHSLTKVADWLAAEMDVRDPHGAPEFAAMWCLARPLRMRKVPVEAAGRLMGRALVHSLGEEFSVDAFLAIVDIAIDRASKARPAHRMQWVQAFDALLEYFDPDQGLVLDRMASRLRFSAPPTTLESPDQSPREQLSVWLRGVRISRDQVADRAADHYLHSPEVPVGLQGTELLQLVREAARRIGNEPELIPRFRGLVGGVARECLKGRAPEGWYLYISASLRVAAGALADQVSIVDPAGWPRLDLRPPLDPHRLRVGIFERSSEASRLGLVADVFDRLSAAGGIRELTRLARSRVSYGLEPPGYVPGLAILWLTVSKSPEEHAKRAEFQKRMVTALEAYRPNEFWLAPNSASRWSRQRSELNLASDVLVAADLLGIFDGKLVAHPFHTDLQALRFLGAPEPGTEDAAALYLFDDPTRTRLIDVQWAPTVMSTAAQMAADHPAIGERYVALCDAAFREVWSVNNGAPAWRNWIAATQSMSKTRGIAGLPQQLVGSNTAIAIMRGVPIGASREQGHGLAPVDFREVARQVMLPYLDRAPSVAIWRTPTDWTVVMTGLALILVADGISSRGYYNRSRAADLIVSAAKRLHGTDIAIRDGVCRACLLLAALAEIPSLPAPPSEVRTAIAAVLTENRPVIESLIESLDMPADDKAAVRALLERDWPPEQMMSGP